MMGYWCKNVDDFLLGRGLLPRKKISNRALANKQTNMIQYHLNLKFIEPLIVELKLIPLCYFSISSCVWTREVNIWIKPNSNWQFVAGLVVCPSIHTAISSFTPNDSLHLTKYIKFIDKTVSWKSVSPNYKVHCWTDDSTWVTCFNLQLENSIIFQNSPVLREISVIWSFTWLIMWQFFTTSKFTFRLAPFLNIVNDICDYMSPPIYSQKVATSDNVGWTPKSMPHQSTFSKIFTSWPHKQYVEN